MSLRAWGAVLFLGDRVTVKELGTARPVVSHRRFHWPIALTLVAAIVAVLIAFVFFRMETWPARTAAHSTAELERVARDLRNGFVNLAQLQPRVTVNNRVYLEQTAAMAELAMVTRHTEVDHEFMHTWAGSTKRLKLHGSFAVKAGFDLRERFTIDVNPDAITVQLPHARILDVEQEKVEVLAYENGFWNPISAADIENQLAVLPQLAREKSAAANLPDEAEAALKKRVEELAHAKQPVLVVFAQPSPAG
jgi:hypothetical protein